MSRKHNTKHFRASGGYARRLVKRGLSRTPAMTPWNPEKLAAARRREGR